MGQQISYRESHKQKGVEYHRTFEEMPHRRMVWRLEKRVLDKIVRRYLRDRRPDHLDFASGTGRVLGHLANKVESSTAVDISDSMLEVAQKNVPDARIVVGDITKEDLLSGERFDLITAFRFFPNAEEDLRREVISELAKRLRPGGVLVFNNHINRESLLHRLSSIRRGVVYEDGMTDAEACELTEFGGLKILNRYPVAVAPLSENYMWFPRLAYWLERMLTRIPGVPRIARNVIYVCSSPG